MKRLWILLLLISVGLNVGLGIQLLGSRAPVPPESGPRRHAAVGKQAAADSVGWRRMMNRRMGRLEKELELTPDQAAAFHRIHSDIAHRFAPQRSSVETARGVLHGLMMTEEVPGDELRAAVRDLSRSRATLDSLVTEAILLEMEALEPHQRVKYLKMLPLDRGFGRDGRKGGRRNREGEDPPGHGKGFREQPQGADSQ